ncbi:MAG: hypothetical protein WDN67_02520 [Candidatus Moraniibacteriota bacterium]
MAAKETAEMTKTDTPEAVSPMEKLLDEHLVSIPEVGDVVQGTVMYVGGASALIDLGPLGTASS